MRNALFLLILGVGIISGLPHPEPGHYGGGYRGYSGHGGHGGYGYRRKGLIHRFSFINFKITDICKHV